MEYKVVPFRADIMAGEGATKAANQLSELINQHAQVGWNYLGLETLVTLITTPATEGTKGCFGIGATPGLPASTSRTEVYVAVFQRETAAAAAS